LCLCLKATPRRTFMYSKNDFNCF